MPLENNGKPSDTFVNAVACALADGGEDVLRSGYKLKSYLYDHAEDCPELRVMNTQCDDELLEPFALADPRDKDSLSRAVSETVMRLTTERMVSETPARMTAVGLAMGIATWTGTSYHARPYNQSREANNPRAKTGNTQNTRGHTSTRFSAQAAKNTPKSKAPNAKVSKYALWFTIATVVCIIIRGTIKQADTTATLKSTSNSEAENTELVNANETVEDATAKPNETPTVDSKPEPEPDLWYDVPENYRSYQGEYGISENGVYTSEVLGFRVTPTEYVTPSYENLGHSFNGSVDGEAYNKRLIDFSYDIWENDCRNGTESNRKRASVQLFEHPYLGNIDLSTYSIVDLTSGAWDQYTAEPVTFCGRTWWLFDYDITVGSATFHYHDYYTNCNGVVVGIAVSGDIDIWDSHGIQAFSALE